MTIKEKIIAVLTGFYLFAIILVLLYIIFYDFITKEEKTPYLKGQCFLFIKNITNFFITVVVAICFFEDLLKWLGEK